MCYRNRLLINKFNDRGTGYELERTFMHNIKFVNGPNTMYIFQNSLHIVFSECCSLVRN